MVRAPRVDYNQRRPQARTAAVLSQSRDRSPRPLMDTHLPEYKLCAIRYDDVTHCYENMGEGRPFTAAFNIGNRLDAYDVLRAHAPSQHRSSRRNAERVGARAERRRLQFLACRSSSLAER